jgi:tRNA pseudouridine13 synthase
MMLPTGKPLEIEQQVFEQCGLKPEDFRVEGRLRVKGTRRPLRIRPTNIELNSGVDDFGPHITVAFDLPAGSFATVLMRELMKNDEQPSMTPTGGGGEGE